MSLDLGELVGYLKLDASGFDGVLDKLPDRIKGKGAVMAAGGAAVGGAVALALGKGLNDAIDFDATNRTVGAQLGLTADVSARVGTLAGQVYASNYGESVEQVQQTIGGVITQIKGMGKASDDEVSRMTANVLSYASAYEVDTADAIGLVQQLMSSGLAGSADEAMDLMTAAMQKVPEALRGDMTDAITEYGPLLAGMGFSGQEAFDLLARGAEKGMYGIDKAGDAVKEFGIRATDMSKASAVGYDILGMNQEEMTKKLLAGGDTAKGAFDKIVKGLQGVKDPADQSQAALALFGTPLEDLGVTGIPKFLGSLTSLGGGFDGAGGSADALNAKLSSGVGAGMENVQRQLQILVAGFMEQLMPVLEQVFTFLAENPDVVQALAIAMGVLAVAFAGVTIATWAMNTAILANPITWLVIAIMALIAAVVLLVMHWGEVVTGMTELWQNFMDWLIPVLEGFAGWWSDFWGAVGAKITEIWNGFCAFVGEVFLGFVGWLNDTADGFYSWWNGFWGKVGSTISDIWNGFIAFVVGVFLGFVGWLRDTGSNILSWWNGLWGAVGGFLRNAWDGYVGFLSGVVGGLVSFFRSSFGGVASFLSGIWSGIGDVIRDTWNGVTSFLGGIPDTIMGFFSGIGTWLFSAGADLINGLLDGISSLAGTIGSFFLNLLPGWIVGPFKAALGIHSPSKLFGEFGRNTVQGYLNEVRDMRPELDREMRDLVDAPALSVTAANSTNAARKGATAQAPASKTVNYYAGDGSKSLSAEEELYAALGRSRGEF